MAPPDAVPLPLLLRLLLLLAAAVVTGRAQPVPTCPGIQVAAYAFPAFGTKPGASVRVYVSVRNKGRNPLRDVGLRVSLPQLEVRYKTGAAKVIPAFKWGEGATDPVFEAPQVYWPRFTLNGGQTRLFRLKAQVRKTQLPGTFPVGVAAYRPGLNCSSGPKTPLQVRVDLAGQTNDGTMWFHV